MEWVVCGPASKGLAQASDTAAIELMLHPYGSVHCAGQQACDRHCARHAAGLPADDQAGHLHPQGRLHEHPDVAGGLGWQDPHACCSQAPAPVDWQAGDALQDGTPVFDVCSYSCMEQWGMPWLSCMKGKCAKNTTSHAGAGLSAGSVNDACGWVLNHSACVCRCSTCSCLG